MEKQSLLTNLTTRRLRLATLMEYFAALVIFVSFVGLIIYIVGFYSRTFTKPQFILTKPLFISFLTHYTYKTTQTINSHLDLLIWLRRYTFDSLGHFTFMALELVFGYALCCYSLLAN